MLYLITGANGAGKTLNTLKWVRERQLKETRPVAHNGRFDAVEGGELSSWKKIDIKNWQDEPDGTIFLIDECHNDFPLRPPSSTPPDYVKMLAEHRRRGFDFYLITQHPQNIDSFVRRLIGPPGWHRHLKRSFGVDMVSCLEWPAANPNCEKSGSGKDAQITMVAYPKEVYAWYRSASLHTGKKRLPLRLIALPLLVVALVLVVGFAWSMLGSKTDVGKKAGAKPATQAGAVAEVGPVQKVSTADYINARRPRITDFPHTAPAYDEVTKPSIAPYPAACVSMGPRCDCYSQQGTYLHMSKETCLQVVKNGFFVDWPQDRERRDVGAHRGRYPDDGRNVIDHRAYPVPVSVPAAGAAPAAVVPGAVALAPTQPGSEWSQGLAARNAEVRSALGR